MTPWLHTAGVAVSLLFYGGIVSGQAPSRQPASPDYQGLDVTCPSRCVVSGPHPSNWSSYHNMDQLNRCDETLFYGFSLYDQVDDPETPHRIFACASYGHDWDDKAKAKLAASRPAKDVTVDYEIGWGEKVVGASTPFTSLIRQIREYVANGHAAANKTTMLYAQFGTTTAGVYIGQGLHAGIVGSVALAELEREVTGWASYKDSLVMQLCGPSYDCKDLIGNVL